MSLKEAKSTPTRGYRNKTTHSGAERSNQTKDLSNALDLFAPTTPQSLSSTPAWTSSRMCEPSGGHSINRVALKTNAANVIEAFEFWDPLQIQMQLTSTLCRIKTTGKDEKYAAKLQKRKRRPFLNHPYMKEKPMSGKCSIHSRQQNRFNSLYDL